MFEILSAAVDCDHHAPQINPVFCPFPSRTPKCLAPSVLFSSCLASETKYPGGRFILFFSKMTYLCDVAAGDF